MYRITYIDICADVGTLDGLSVDVLVRGRYLHNKGNYEFYVELPPYCWWGDDISENSFNTIVTDNIYEALWQADEILKTIFDEYVSNAVKSASFDSI